MKLRWIGLLLAVLALWAWSQARPGWEFEHGGRIRRYRLHLPPRDVSGRALVMVLHGGSGSGRQIERLTGFSQLADQEGFVVVYPDGVDRAWNDGRGDSLSRAHREKVDDVGFLTRLADRLVQQYHLDPARVYVTGISNGGFMSQRLGVEAAQRFVAIAPVAAGLPANWADKAKPALPVSVMIVQGTRDPLVPYAGGFVQVGHQQRGRMLSTQETVRHWLTWNAGVLGGGAAAPSGGAKPPLVDHLPDKDPRDGCRVARQRYAGVELWRIEGGGHTWPGASQYLPQRLVGSVCRDFNATREIWNFFAAHPRAQ